MTNDSTVKKALSRVCLKAEAFEKALNIDGYLAVSREAYRAAEDLVVVAEKHLDIAWKNYEDTRRAADKDRRESK